MFLSVLGVLCFTRLEFFVNGSPFASYPGMRPAFTLLAAAGALAAQDPSPTRQPEATAVAGAQSAPIFRITVVSRSIRAVQYPRGVNSRVDFRGTPLLPQATGEAKVESRTGSTRVETKFDHLSPATQFGPEYLTYVLWAITPEGRPVNLGEVVLDGDKSELKATTPLQSFGLIVTAEPYFAVTQPSDVVVMENVERRDTAGTLAAGGRQVRTAAPRRLRLQPRRLPPGAVRGQGRPATGRGAQRGGDRPRRRSRALRRRHAGARRAGIDQRRALRAGPRKRAGRANHGARRRAGRRRRARDHLPPDPRGTTGPAARGGRAGQGHGRGGVRASAEEARREREAAEQAKREAEAAAATARTEREAAERARQEALEQQRLAQTEASRAKGVAQQAELERNQLRQRLQQQLNMVLETRETARGLVSNIGDVLFDFNKATIKPAARERLAKVAGILLAYPGLNVRLEGHTDNVGSPQYNVKLSQERADAVRNYLVQQGIQAASVTAVGLGEADPVAGNETAAGRQQNRRVELVVAGEAIGIPAPTGQVTAKRGLASNCVLGNSLPVPVLPNAHRREKLGIA